MFCFVSFIFNITFPKVRSHFIANEMAKQIHYVFCHLDRRLSVCSVQGKPPLDLSCLRRVTSADRLSSDPCWPSRAFVKEGDRHAEIVVFQLFNNIGIVRMGELLEQVPRTEVKGNDIG